MIKNGIKENSRNPAKDGKRNKTPVPASRRFHFVLITHHLPFPCRIQYVVFKRVTRIIR